MDSCLHEFVRVVVLPKDCVLPLPEFCTPLGRKPEEGGWPHITEPVLKESVVRQHGWWQLRHYRAPKVSGAERTGNASPARRHVSILIKRSSDVVPWTY